MPSNVPKAVPPAYPSSLIVYAQLSGKRTIVVRLLVDTGATYTMIPMKAAMVMGCDPVAATRRIPLVTVSAVEYTPVVTIPSLKCLGQHLRHVDVVCHDLPPQSAVDGLVGLDVLMHIPPFRSFLQAIHTYLLKP